jgi:hypothetical protein
MPSGIVPHALLLASSVVLVALSLVLALMALAMVFRARRLCIMGPQEHRLVCNGHLVLGGPVGKFPAIFSPGLTKSNSKK